MNHCIDCGKQISQKAKRCNSCAGKVRWARGDYDDPETCRKRSESVKAAWARGDYDSVFQTLEFRRKSSESMKAAWARGDFDDLETRRKMSENTKAAHARGDFDGVFQTPEFRRKSSESVKAAHTRGDYDDPETRRKKSEGIKAAHARGDYDDPETRRKFSEATKAAWVRGDFDDLEIRHKWSEATKVAWMRGDYDGIFQSPTSIELQLAAALDICGIEHISQYRPDGCGFVFDEFIPPAILIEAHGDYWHGQERPDNQARDVKKAAWAEKKDYKLIVIWEHEIEEQGTWGLVIERVLPLTGKY